MRAAFEFLSDFLRKILVGFQVGIVIMAKER